MNHLIEAATTAFVTDISKLLRVAAVDAVERALGLGSRRARPQRPPKTPEPAPPPAKKPIKARVHLLPPTSSAAPLPTTPTPSRRPTAPPAPAPAHTPKRW